MLGVCLDFCTVQKDKATIEKHKVSTCVFIVHQCIYILFCGLRLCIIIHFLFFSRQSAMLDLYMKSVLMSKTKPQQHILDKSGALLRHISHSEFKEQLLPTLQKTMLRSPENAMQSETLLSV